jgi:hypothetical protein
MQPHRLFHLMCAARMRTGDIAAVTVARACALCFAFSFAAGGLFSGGLRPAQAQSATAGAITGVVVELASGEPLPGVIIEVTSRSLLGKRTAFTDERGAYKITELPPGEYAVRFYHDRLTVKRTGIVVGVQKATPVFQTLDASDASDAGEVIEIEDAAPAIDPTSSTQGLTIEGEVVRYLPTFGRTFEDTLDAAAGAQIDRLGAAFSGSTSLENQFTVDGMNTSTLRYGASGTSLIHDFVEETEVITGGYNAEYGRATGAVINVATKSGTNRLAGSVFGYLAAGALAGEPERTHTQGSSIDSLGKTVYDTSFGAELGGPIVPDRLFFLVGFAPRRAVTETTRITKRQVDCRAIGPASGPASGGLSGRCDPRPVAEGGLADGVPDRIADTQQLLYEDVDRQVRGGETSAYSAIGKLSFAASPDHQGQISLIADRTVEETPGIVGLPDTGLQTATFTLDGVARWTSKLDDSKTEIEALFGWHRGATDIGAVDERLNSVPAQQLLGGSLADYAGFGGESARTAAQCRDGGDGGDGDDYPLIANCPMDSAFYATGGPGLLTRGDEERRSGRLGAIRRFDLLGSHEAKAGLDLEQNLRSSPRLYSGGAQIQNVVGQLVHIQRFVQLQPPGEDGARYGDVCRTAGADGQIAELGCAYLDGRQGSFGTAVDGETFNWSVYLRDSWRPISNLTFNLGVRYEEQRLRYAEQIRNQPDPFTGKRKRFGTNAMVLRDQWAPRLGVLYDWTSQGRSKVYAHWGRFYESIPLDLNDRSFGGEVVYQQDFSPDTCLNPGEQADPRIGGASGLGCLSSAKAGDLGEAIVGASGTLIAPGIEGQYLDETLAGVEYELLPDLVIGAALQYRTLGRVIEDVSTDGASTYIVANPGSFSAAEERKLEEQLARTEEQAQRAQLAYELEQYRGIRRFDRPQRDYTALTLTARHRLTAALYLQASYTYARTRGNYPGTLSYDNDQVDPNNSSQYDLIELLDNRRGPLPQDRPHAVKLDGAYVFDLSRRDSLTFGARLRASSGQPITALGAHPSYGANEVFLLPRGALGRTELDHNLSVRLSYARALRGNMTLEVFADLFNVYDHQAATAVDQTYAPGLVDNTTRSISGGSYEDLVWLKASGGGDRAGFETEVDGKPYGPAQGNLNFRNTTARTAPIATQFGMRLVF